MKISLQNARFLQRQEIKSAGNGVYFSYMSIPSIFMTQYLRKDCVLQGNF